MPFAWVAAGAAVVGAYASYSAGQQSAEAAEEAKKQAALHARLNLMRQNREAYRGIGAEEASTAAAGFSLSGSAIDLLKSSVSDASLDAALISSGGHLEGLGYEAQARASRAEGTAAAASGIASAATALGAKYG